MPEKVLEIFEGQVDAPDLECLITQNRQVDAQIPSATPSSGCIAWPCSIKPTTNDFDCGDTRHKGVSKR